MTPGQIALYGALGGYLLVGLIMAWSVWDVWISGNTGWLYRGRCEDCTRGERREDEEKRAILLEGIERFPSLRLLLAAVLLALIGGWPVVLLIAFMRKDDHG